MIAWLSSVFSIIVNAMIYSKGSIVIGFGGNV